MICLLFLLSVWSAPGCLDGCWRVDAWPSGTRCTCGDGMPAREKYLEHIHNLWPNGQSNKIDGYWWYGLGFCKSVQGHDPYYKGWEMDSNWETQSIEHCAERCTAEEKCMYFSYRPGKTCSRYTAEAKECDLYDDSAFGQGDDGWMTWHYTYRKKDFQIPRPESDVKMFKYLAGYEYVDQGYCQDGLYSEDDDGKSSMTVEKCKETCEAESNCAYFAVRTPSVHAHGSCRRYSLSFGKSLKEQGCRTNVQPSSYNWLWATYKKLEECTGPVMENTDFWGNDLNAGGWFGRVKGHLKDWQTCRKVCDSMSACKSWTFVKGQPAAYDNCAVKSTSPSQGRSSPSTCCDSGGRCDS